MPLPLQMTASIFLDNKSPAPSAVGCLPPRLHSCRLVTSCWSWGTPRSDVSRGVGLSLSTVILMQLPAFLRALTASWWVAPCMLRPLTWMGSRHIIDLWLVKVGAGVRGDGALKITCQLWLEAKIGIVYIGLKSPWCESKDWFTIFRLKCLLICSVFVSLMVDLSQEATAECPLLVLWCPPLVRKRTSAGRKRNESHSAWKHLHCVSLHFTHRVVYLKVPCCAKFSCFHTMICICSNDRHQSNKSIFCLPHFSGSVC